MSSAEDDLQNLKLRIELVESEKKSIEGEQKHFIKEHERKVDKVKQTNSALKQLIQESKGNTKLGSHYENEINLRKQQDLLKYKLGQEEIQKQELLKNSEIKKSLSLQSDKDIMSSIENIKQKTNITIIKSQEANSLRKVYEQLCAGFQEESNTFDSKIKKLEDSLAAKIEELKKINQNELGSFEIKEKWKNSVVDIENEIELLKTSREEQINDKKDELYSITAVEDEDDGNMMMEKDEGSFSAKSDNGQEDEEITLYRLQRISELSAIVNPITSSLLIEDSATLKLLVTKLTNQLKQLKALAKEVTTNTNQSISTNATTPANSDPISQATTPSDATVVVEIENQALLRFKESIYRKTEKLQSSKHKAVADFDFKNNSKPFDERLSQVMQFYPKKSTESDLDLISLYALAPIHNQRISFKKKPFSPFLPYIEEGFTLPTRDVIKKQSLAYTNQVKQKTGRKKSKVT